MQFFYYNLHDLIIRRHTIVMFTKHLKIFFFCFTTLTPWNDMISFHFILNPYGICMFKSNIIVANLYRISYHSMYRVSLNYIGDTSLWNALTMRINRLFCCPLLYLLYHFLYRSMYHVYRILYRGDTQYQSSYFSWKS